MKICDGWDRRRGDSDRSGLFCSAWLMWLESYNFYLSTEREGDLRSCF